MMDINYKILFTGFLILFVHSFGYGQNPKYNVLFIAIDDLNDYVTLLEGYPGLQTPHLDKFAKSSLTFSRAYCAAPVCNPSRVAVLTGEKPIRTGVYDNQDPFQQSEQAVEATLLPELFKQNNYTTAWSGKIFHTKPTEERLTAMWDDMEGHDGGYGPIPTVDNVTEEIKRPPWFNYQIWEGPDSDFPDVVNAHLTVKRLQQTYDKPFFMALGLYRPHNPWTAPRRFFNQYPLDSVRLPNVPEDDLNDIPAIGQEWAHHPVELKELKKIGQWKPVLRSYLASISFMDESLGKVLEALDQSQYRDNTIVVLWADHGFHMGEKEHFAKYALWEKTTHVMMMMRIPGMTKGGQVIGQPVNLLDIYPTLVELCNLSAPAQSLDGFSLVPMIKNPEVKRPEPSITYYQGGSIGVRTERFRYIHYHDGSEELYDEENDPQELTNLADDQDYAEVIEEMSAWLPDRVQQPVGQDP